MNKNGKILNVLLSIIAILVIIFVIFWIVNRSRKAGNNAIDFAENLNNIQNVAKDYFKDNLPNNIGEEKTLTLNELYNLGLIDTVTYNKKSCDSRQSYISITKLNKTDYQVISNLVCDGVSDNIIEKVKSNIVVKDDKGSIIADDSEEDTIIKTETKKDENNQAKTSATEKCTVDSGCDIIVIPTNCETTYNWEFVKKDATCNNGYENINGTCVKSYEKTMKPGITVISEKAKEKTGKEYKVYTDIIETKDKDEYKCTTGKVNGQMCDIYKAKDKKCPSDDYTLKDDGYCYKYEKMDKVTKDGKCPSGYSPNGSNCVKYNGLDYAYTDWGNPVKSYYAYSYEEPYTTATEKKVISQPYYIEGVKLYTVTIYTRYSYSYCSVGTPVGNYCMVTKPYDVAPSEELKCHTSSYTKTGDGKTCYTKIKASEICTDGYKETSDGRCIKQVPATKIEGKVNKSCPDPYKLTDDQKQCYMTKKSDSTYYCENANAKLNGNICTYIKDSTKCENGYSYNSNDKLCHKTFTETTGLNWTIVDRIYSSSDYIAGYQKTGRGTYKTVCTSAISK